MSLSDREHGANPAGEGLSEHAESPQEPLPADVAARTRALLEAEIQAMQPMSWAATVLIMIASSVVLLPGVGGLSNLTLPVLVATPGLCGGYALLVRVMAPG